VRAAVCQSNHALICSKIEQALGQRVVS
jgi:hypothetical protein